jgi:hypothetical protein
MKGGKSKTRKKATNNLEEKMKKKGFTQRDKKKIKKRVRFNQNFNAFTHRLGLTGRKSINEIQKTAVERQLEKIKTRRSKNSHHKKKRKTRAKEKKDNIKGNGLLNELRSSLRPIKKVKISLSTPRALSRRIGSIRS